MNDIYFKILLSVLLIIIILFSFGAGVGLANKNDTLYPWYHYQLNSGQALYVDCAAASMSIIPQNNLSILIICGNLPIEGDKYVR